MNLDKAFCLVHLLKTEEYKERVRAWFFRDDGVLAGHLVSGTLAEMNQRLLDIYGHDHAPILVLAPNGKCAIKTVNINKGQLKFARQVIESTLEPLLASDIQDTHFEFTITGTVAQVCAVNKVELENWRRLTGELHGALQGMYSVESILAASGTLDESSTVEFSDTTYTLSKGDVVGILSSIFSMIHRDTKVHAISEIDIVDMLKVGMPLLNLHNNRSQRKHTSIWSVLTSWYFLPNIILLILFIVLEVSATMMSQNTKAIEEELQRSYVLMFPDERVVSLYKQYEYKFNTLKNGKQSQAPSSVYDIFVALEKTTQSLIGQHSIESLNYMRGQYSIQWVTENRAQLDQIRQSLIRQKLNVSLVSWQKNDEGFVGNYLIQNEDTL